MTHDTHISSVNISINISNSTTRSHIKVGLLNLLTRTALCLIVCILAWCTFCVKPAFAISGNEIDTQLLPDSSFLYDTSIATLAAADSYYDGQTVRVTGEVVGDRLWADNNSYCWITLTETSDNVDATVQVYMSAEQASRIDTYGAYGQHGTTLSVQGTFHLVCSEHDGESDIHVDSVTVSESGEVYHEDFQVKDFIPGVLVVVIGLVMTFVLWRLQERSR